MDDALAALVRDGEADPDTLAMVLAGSRGAGHERPDSDYDIHYIRRTDTRPVVPDYVEAATTTLEELREVEPYWWTDAMVQGRVVLDKTGGELEAILARLGTANDVDRPYDGYLNAFVRGKAAAFRGDELGARARGLHPPDMEVGAAPLAVAPHLVVDELRRLEHGVAQEIEALRVR